MRRPIRPTLLLPLLVAGCLGLPLPSGGGSDRDVDPGDAVDSDAAPDTFSARDAVWGVAGELVLTEGLLDVSMSSLQLATRGVACDVRAAIEDATPITVPEGVEDVFQLWRFDVSTEGDGSCTFLGPTTLLLGFGPTSSALEPAAARAGYDASRAYSLLLGTPTEEPMLAGLAATAAQLDGTEPATGTLPLPDGQYGLVTLHGIPLER